MQHPAAQLGQLREEQLEQPIGERLLVRLVVVAALVPLSIAPGRERIRGPTLGSAPASDSPAAATVATRVAATNGC
jgi:hypothetical protein